MLTCVCVFWLSVKVDQGLSLRTPPQTQVEWQATARNPSGPNTHCLMASLAGQSQSQCVKSCSSRRHDGVIGSIDLVCGHGSGFFGCFVD